MKSLLALAAAGLIILQVSRTHQAAQKQAIIQEHEVVPAMTRTEVRQSLGTPSDTSRDSSGQETWIYANGTTATYVVFSRVGVVSTRREILVAPYRPAIMAEARHAEIPRTVAPGAVVAPSGLPFRSVGSRLDVEPRRVGVGTVSRVRGEVPESGYANGGRSVAPVAGERAVIHRMPGVVVAPYVHQ